MFKCQVTVDIGSTMTGHCQVLCFYFQGDVDWKKKKKKKNFSLEDKISRQM